MNHSVSFFSSRRRHTRYWRDWSSDVCSSDLGRRIKELYKGSRKKRDRLIGAMTWDYPTEGEREEPHIESILKEINGYEVETGEPVSGFLDLKDDGSTACGGWIYSGVYADGVNQARRRKPWTEQNQVAAEWGWAWPANRRILYNRASADPEGKPWSRSEEHTSELQS